MPIQTVTEANLDSILLSTEEINNIMGASHMEVTKSGRTLDETTHSVSDPNCFGSIYSGEKSVYAGSGWRAVSDYDKAIAVGCESVSPPSRLERWPVTMAYVKDFDGYLVEFVEYHEGTPPGVPDPRDFK